MTSTQKRLFRNMMARSFAPSQWYQEDDDRLLADEPMTTEIKMWVFRRSGEVYEVGHYDPTGNWHHDDDFATRYEAAERVHFLNGGSGDPHGIQEAVVRGFRDQNVGRYR